MRNTIPAQSLVAGAPDMTLRERQEWEERIKVVQDAAASSSKACDSTNTAQWDVSSWKQADLDNSSPSSACRDAVFAIGAACKFSDAGKKAVQSEVSSLTCRRSEAGTKPVRQPPKAVLVVIDTAHPVNPTWKTAFENVL